jgi:hypothetical protein
MTMITGININQNVEFISQYDTDKENPTIFVLGPLDAMTDEILNDSASSFDYDPKRPDSMAKVQIKYSQKKLNVLRACLKDIKNMQDPSTGKPLEFKTTATPIFGKSRNVVSDEILKIIPKKIRDEIHDKIMEISSLSEDEEKN